MVQDSHNGSTVLMEVELPVLTNAACKKLESSFPEPQSPFDMSIQLCAGQKGSDTCQGDSGNYAQ